MNIREISKPVTANALNESLAKKFGAKINIDAFTVEQLQDARNKVRTKLSQVETNESFDAVQNETYQQSKLFLDVLNAAIVERGVDVVEAAKPDFADLDKDGDKKEPMKKAAKDAKKKKTNESSLNESDSSVRRILTAVTNHLSKIASKDEELQSSPHLTFILDQLTDLPTEPDEIQDIASGILNLVDDTSNPKIIDALEKLGNELYTAFQQEMLDDDDYEYESQFSESRNLREGEEDKAELTMASKDMVDKLTGWMEDTSEMQTESMLELADAIRDELGSETSESFVNTVKPALEALYATMETTRSALTQGVGIITGEAEPADTMGADDLDMDADLDMEPTVDGDDMDMEAPLDGDDFGAAAAATGGEEEAGRAKRESVERSRRLGKVLSSKK